MAEENETLESLLNKATNPAMREEDWEAISAFCDQVNKELEGSQIAVRLLAHKIQSPQEREALYALSTLEQCVKNCGRYFHQEIGKFRFLNEIIKVVSPKYLGSRTTDRVKKRCIEILYSWHLGLKHETKITEAYTMLKTQGIVKEDPTYINKTLNIPAPKPRLASFEDEEKAKTLARLLKSKNPEDLQAANRLIKNMVKEDAERSERVSRRINELAHINNQVKLLDEMVAHYSPSSSSAADKEMMKELSESLEKLRPNLFRLASDADDRDSDSLNEILQTNDAVMKSMTMYKRTVEGVTTDENGMTLAVDGTKDVSSLLDLNFDPSPGRTEGATAAILNDQFQAMGLANSAAQSPSQKPGGSSVLSELDDIFSAVSSQQNSTNAFTAASAPSVFTSAAMMGSPVRAPPPAYSPSQPLGTGFTPQTMAPPRPAAAAGFSFAGTPSTVAGAGPAPAAAAANAGVTSTATTAAAQKSMSDLDILGQDLLQQSRPKDPAFVPPVPQQKIPMNQMASGSGGQAPQTAANSVPQLVPSSQTTLLSLASAVPPGANPPAPAKPSTPTPLTGAGDTSSTPNGTPSQELLPLTDVFVPLESIQPGDHQPVNAYDKDGLKILLHIAKDRPRPDVIVAVISTMNTGVQQIKNFTFQAAVPKIMKVKLQPPSATDLSAYNPILPPAAITQVMLIANPKKENVRLKFKILYKVNEKSISDVGDVENFPVK